ncbi:MAG TPA: SIR2 family protein [Mycobacteriales bacterium]|nr:SIR2 family protein [Mycobacteriales bacterium]
MARDRTLVEVLDAARSIGRLLSAHEEPLTVWLGAGASISSGAPATDACVEAFRELLRGRGDVDDIHNITDLPGNITDFERSNAVAPLFADFSPYLGLRLLVSLARERPLRIITTNWDGGVERSCELIGLPCRSFDIAKMTDDDWQVCEDAEVGTVVVVHLHGTLANPIYSKSSTLPFDQGRRARLQAGFLRYTTVFLGASLSGDDTDVSHLLREAWEARGDSADERPVTFFGRAEPGHGEGAPIAALEVGPSGNNVMVHPRADFDRIVLEIVDGAVAREGRWRVDAPALPLPSRDELVMPDPRLLRPFLDDPVLGIVGEPEIGKTTVSYLLAHVDALIYRSGSMGTADRGVQALNAVGAVPTTPFVIEDPFGTVEYEPTPALIQRLDELAPAGPTGHPSNRVVLSSARGMWARATSQHGQSPTFPVIDAPTDSWYRDDDLASCVPDTHPRRDDVIARLGELATPRRVMEALAGRPATNDPVRDHFEAMRADPPAALLVALTRLQYLVDDAQPAQVLQELAGVDDSTVERVRWALDTFGLDGVAYFRLRRPAHADAADLLIRTVLRPSSDGTAPEFADALREAITKTTWATEALDRFAVLAEVGRGSQAAAGPSAIDLAPYLPVVLARSGNPSLVTPERYEALDQWGVVELTLELARQWRGICRDQAATDLLEMIIADASRFGTYALAETTLYFAASTDQELRDRVTAATWSLLTPDGGRLTEAVRVFDGVLWKEPQAPLGSAEWIRRLFDSIGPDRREWGALLAACAHHPRSSEVLASAGVEHPLDHGLALNAEQAQAAVELIGWHFTHQARNRAMTVRHAVVDMPALRRHRPPITLPDEHGARHLVSALARHSESAGWGVLLAAMLACTDDVAVEDSLLAGIIQNTGVDDAIVLAAVTFELPDESLRNLRRLVDRNADATKRILGALLGGVEVNGMHLSAPRFRFARRASDVLEQLRLQPAELRTLPPVPLEMLPSLLRACAAEAGRLFSVERYWVDEAIAEIEAGHLEQLAVGFRDETEGPDSEPGLVRALGAAALLLREARVGEDRLL